MATMMRRLVGATLAGVLALTSLAGCDSKPKTTAELLERFGQFEQKDNYHFDRTITLGSADGESIELVSTGDVAGGLSHVKTQGNLFGVSLGFDTYCEPAEQGYTDFVSTEVAGKTLWMRKAAQKSQDLSALVAPEVIGDAEFAGSESGYTLTIPADKFVSAMTGSDMTVETLSQSTENSLANAMADAKAVYEFDSDAHLTGISCSATITENAEDGTVTSETPTSVTYTVSGYGTIEEAGVAVPEQVRTEAVDLDAIGSSIDEFMSKMGSAIDTVTEGINSFVDMIGNASDTLSNATETISNATETLSEGAAAAQSYVGDAA